MADRPASYTADRADRVVPGMFIHRDPPLLTEPVPATGWEEVDVVDADTAGVLLSLVSGEAVFFPRDRLLYQGPVTP